MFKSFGWNWKYSKIEIESSKKQDEDMVRVPLDEASPHLSSTSIVGCLKERKLISFVAFFLSVLVSSLVLAVGIWTTRCHCILRTGHSSDKDLDGSRNLCGNSSVEALSLGCSFDQLTWSWYPPGCPHYANDAYLAAENWTFYLDNQKRKAAGPDDWARALDNEVELWGEEREHWTHCIYVFLSISQAIRDGTPSATYLKSYDHGVHCANILLGALGSHPQRNEIGTFVGQVDYKQQCY